MGSDKLWPTIFDRSPRDQMYNFPTDTIRNMLHSQKIQSFLGNGPPEWAIGMKIKAKRHSKDDYTEGKIMAATKNYNFLVYFSNYNERELLNKENIIKISPNLMKKSQTKSPINDKCIKTKKKKIIKSLKKQRRYFDKNRLQTQKVNEWKLFLQIKKKEFLV